MNKYSDGFTYLKGKFPKLNNAKLKEGNFVGPQIRKLLHDMGFECKLNSTELAAWKSFKSTVHRFLGMNKKDNYQQLIEEVLHNYQNFGCWMSLKIHIVHSHLDFLPDNLGTVSNEQGERFNQDISNMEQCYEGRWYPAMMGDYCTVHKRKRQISV